MSRISVHIDRVVLDAGALKRSDAWAFEAALTAAIEAELTQLDGGVSAARAVVRASIAPSLAPDELGRAAGAAIAGATAATLRGGAHG